jgi:hypothetical protein
MNQLTFKQLFTPLNSLLTIIALCYLSYIVYFFKYYPISEEYYIVLLIGGMVYSLLYASSILFTILKYQRKSNK